ncbi:hypothetical protein [Alteromonas lipolytica]|uniref:Flagellar assembly protein T N-terminal domain-containing protein n=1 Tax=Alteromonas lipolytica TaxID=1856405 RepID=A0A1E8F9I2_9ALTE|nr:hypothetical protein [Alteromonas lipolytica]OFI32446.1 hypothetical protein BFC17_06955 [Alteromonas lipolytica]
MIILTISSSPAVAKLVEAKGISEVADNKIVEARKIALENAKRAAVEQVVGTFVRSRTDVNNYLLGKDQIFSTTAGQIDEYKIIYDGVGDNKDIYEVVIQADVRVDLLVDKVAQIQASMGWTKMPRVTVIIDKNSSNPIIAQHARNEMTERLLRDGFQVFDETQPVYAGFAVNLTVDSQVKPEEFQGMKINANELTLSMQVTRVGDNQVLAAGSKSASKPGVKSNSIFSKLSADIIRKEWPQLRKQLIKFWHQEQVKARNIFLDIEGIESLEVANQMKAVIQEAMPAIQQIEISNIANGVAHLVISYKGWTEQLYEELLASNIAQRHKMQIVGVTGNKITATKV